MYGMYDMIAGTEVPLKILIFKKNSGRGDERRRAERASRRDSPRRDASRRDSPRRDASRRDSSRRDASRRGRREEFGKSN